MSIPNLPDHMSEEEFIDILEKVSSKIVHKYRFGHYGDDDLKQECYFLAVEALERYDSSRPLENFLAIHLKNRLFNLKRKKYFRLESPCHKCKLKAYIKKTDSCKIYDNRNDCKPYAAYLIRNNAKKSLMSPTDISYVNSENNKFTDDTKDVCDNISNNEILRIIDSNVSRDMRKYWLQRKVGEHIPKKQQDLLMEEIHQILKDNDIDVEI